jgi:HSP20 family protein
MANLARRQQREREPAPMTRLDPFRTFRDLLRWDPFAEMIDVFPRASEAMVFSPDVDIKETPDALVLKADLPGMRENEVDVAIAGNRLVISGRREHESRREDEQYYAYECQYGSFSRSFTLPDIYDADQVNAELKDGVLTVKVPTRPGAQARHIPLAGQSQSQSRGGGAMESQGTQRGGSSGQSTSAEAGKSGGAAHSKSS